MGEENLKESIGSIDKNNGRVTLAAALSRLPGPKGERFAAVFEHASLQVEIYAPRGHDPQSPHDLDEVYIVMQGSGETPTETDGTDK